MCSEREYRQDFCNVVSQSDKYLVCFCGQKAHVLSVYVYALYIKPTTNSPRGSVATEIAFLRKKKKFTSSFLCTWLTHSVLFDQRCVITGWIEGTI